MIVCYMDKAQSQVPNQTTPSSLLKQSLCAVYGWLQQRLSGCEAPLFMWWDHRPQGKELAWGFSVCVCFVCTVHFWRPWSAPPADDNLAPTPHILIHTWHSDKQTCHPDSSQTLWTLTNQHLNHIHMSMLTTRAVFHLHSCAALAHWEFPFSMQHKVFGHLKKNKTTILWLHPSLVPLYQQLNVSVENNCKDKKYKSYKYCGDVLEDLLLWEINLTSITVSLE